MPYQYIHTSAKRGLEPGKSGFCCVARDRDTPPDLVLELERLSRYESAQGAISPIILRMVKLETRSGSYRIVSRLQDSGVDYSKRNNHIAHHLVFSADEIALLPDPATILLCWTGWKDHWSSPPRVLADRDQFDIQQLDTHYAFSHSDDKFPPLEIDGVLMSRSLLISPGEEIAATSWIRKELQHLSNDLRWEFPFTSFLLTSDKPTDFAWSCTWHERKLPYELELNGKPWHIQKPELAAPQEVPPSNNASEVEPEFPQPPQRSKKFQAPRVEIPQELDRSKLKRPKAKWTPTRFNKTINASILMVAIICIAVTAFFIKGVKESDFESEEAFPNSQASSNAEIVPNPTETARSLEDLQNDWQELLDQQLLYGAKEHARGLARALAERGDPTPSAFLEFLDQTSAANHVVPVPSSALSQDSDQIRLHPSLAYYLAADRYHLLPHSLQQTLQQIAAHHPDVTGLYDRMPSDGFQGESLSIGLHEYRRKLRDKLKSANIDAWVAAQRFDEKAAQLRDNPNLQPYLQIQTNFEQSPDNGYIAYTPSGRIANPSRKSYRTYVVSLFENYVLPRYGRFEANQSFSAALKRLDSNPDSLRYVYEAMLAAIPIDSGYKAKWQTIVSSWRNAFVRSDLMEETLVSYAIDQIEESKSELVALQSRFEDDDLARFRTLATLEPLLEEAIRQAEDASLVEEWIVIPNELAQRP